LGEGWGVSYTPSPGVLHIPPRGMSYTPPSPSAELVGGSCTPPLLADPRLVGLASALRLRGGAGARSGLFSGVSGSRPRSTRPWLTRSIAPLPYHEYGISSSYTRGRR